MSKQPDVVWVNTSPSLQCFDQPLLRYLSCQLTIAAWEYCQSQDEASSLEAALELLHDYLQSCHHPVHLIGHSTGGLLALLYTRQYPEKVKSLTLLAVGADAALDWRAHYYSHLPFLCRHKTLTDMVYNLFGYQNGSNLKRLERILKRDLNSSLSPHSLFKRVSVAACPVPVPFMVCGSKDDIVIEPDVLQGWRPYLMEGDHLWECVEGRHFFHFFHPELVGDEILNFWKSLSLPDSLAQHPISNYFR